MSIQLAKERSGIGFFTGYLLGTPVFLLIDVLFHAPIRIAALQGSNVRFAYYGVAFALGLLARARPSIEPWVGMGETAFNILLLVLAIMIPIWNLPDALLANEPLVGPFDTIPLTNFGLSGSILLVGYYRSQARAFSRRRPPGALP